jgi:hypothetical protein
LPVPDTLAPEFLFAAGADLLTWLLLLLLLLRLTVFGADDSGFLEGAAL